LSFDTTRWSVIAAARGSDPDAARAALSTLCEAYWYPLYAFIRRWGADPDAARDLTQAFLTSLLERRDIEQVRPDRGRFRTFLLASVKHFLLNEAVRSRAMKRGGGVPLLPLAFDEAEGRYQFEPVDQTTPETLYERRWALTVIERVIARVQTEWHGSGRGAEFDVLKSSLLGQGPPGGYAAAAEKLRTTEGAVKTAIHRLRKTFRMELRAAIAETVADAADVGEELRYLERALRS
jgi:RNA polymerase sigma-70 factor (ECF subfamily)